MKTLNEIISQPKPYLELSNKLTNHYGSLLADSKGKASIKNYTRNPSINSYLWDKHKKINHIENFHHEDDSKHIDKALNKIKSPHDLTVWSSTLHDPRKLKNENNIVHHPAYLSTTTYHPVATNREINTHVDAAGTVDHHILKIHVPKGSKGAYVAHMSNYPTEHEFMLPRGSNLKYHSTETKKETYFNHYHEKRATKNTHIHHMELVE